MEDVKHAQVFRFWSCSPEQLDTFIRRSNRSSCRCAFRDSPNIISTECFHNKTRARLAFSCVTRRYFPPTNIRQGMTFTAEDVLEMTRKTRELLPTTPLSVTVPHTLDLDEQVKQGMVAQGNDVCVSLSLPRERSQ